MVDLALYLAIAAAGYLIGSFPTAYLIVRWSAGKNIMELGSGNVGTLNVLRATGSKMLTAANLAGDVTKGVLAMLVGLGVAAAAGLGGDGAVAADVAAWRPPPAMGVGGISAVIGHNYSVFLRFQGGKGIATALPVLFVFQPVLVAVWVAGFLVTAVTTRILVLGQILATVVTPFVAYTWFQDTAFEVTLLGIIVFIRHASRIPGIVKGTEPRLYYKIDKDQDA